MTKMHREHPSTRPSRRPALQRVGACVALALVSALTLGVSAQDHGAPAGKEPNADRTAEPTAGIVGQVVPSLDPAIWRIHHARNGDQDITLFTISKDHQGVLWLGTHTAGPYRFNGQSFEKFKP